MVEYVGCGSCRHRHLPIDKMPCRECGVGNSGWEAGVILAIDPGPVHSAYVLYAPGEEKPIIQAGYNVNEGVRIMLKRGDFEYATKRLAIETITYMGCSAGGAVFDTCIWIGRFQEVWDKWGASRLIPRGTVKRHLCLTEPVPETEKKREKQLKEIAARKRKWAWTLAKDKHVRWALINRIGPQGTQAKPGPTHGMRSHLWSALAVAVTAAETWGEHV